MINTKNDPENRENTKTTTVRVADIKHSLVVVFNHVESCKAASILNKSKKRDKASTTAKRAVLEAAKAPVINLV